MQEEGCSFGGREAFQSVEECGGYRVVDVELLGWALFGNKERFGEPGADVGLALVLGGLEAVEGEATANGDQPRASGLDFGVVLVGPFEIGLLDNVFGFRDGPEHAVGDAVEEGAVGFEVVNVHEIYGVGYCYTSRAVNAQLWALPRARFMVGKTRAEAMASASSATIVLL